jgi:hypothetical protein
MAKKKLNAKENTLRHLDIAYDALFEVGAAADVGDGDRTPLYWELHSELEMLQEAIAALQARIGDGEFDAVLMDPAAYRHKHGRWASPDGTVPPIVKKARSAKAGGR